MEFGSLVLPGPNNGEKILQALYGNFMRFPPNLLKRRHADWNEFEKEEVEELLRRLENSGYLNRAGPR